MYATRYRFRYRFFAMGVLVVALLSIGSNIDTKKADSRPSFANTWQSTYPNSASFDQAGCQLCHQRAGGGDGWNEYGWNIRQAIIEQELSIDEAIAAAATMDSDGNDVSNLDEINANAQPGWTGGSTNAIYFSDGLVLQDQLPPNGISLLDSPISNELPGDVDCDDDVDSVDALFALQYTVDRRSDYGSCPLADRTTQLHAATGDMNSDGQTNAVDALFILQCVAGVSNGYCDGVNAAAMQPIENNLVGSVSLAAQHDGQSLNMQLDAQTTAVGAGTITLTYDSRGTSLTNCVPTGQGVCNENAAGTIQIAFVDVAGLSGKQSIAELTFDNANVVLSAIHATAVNSIGQALAVEATSTDSTPIQLDDSASLLFIPLINR